MKEKDDSEDNDIINEKEDFSNIIRFKDNDDNEEIINNINFDLNNNEGNEIFDRLCKLQKLIKKESTLRELSKT